MPRNKNAEEAISGKTIKCKTNKYTSVISISVLNMLYRKPGNIDEMKIEFDDHGLMFSWREKEYTNVIRAGMNGEYGVSEISLGDLRYHTYSKAAWQEDGTLKLWIRPVETAHVRKFTFKFDGNRVKIKNEMTPTFEELTLYYLTFMGMPAKPRIAQNFIENAVHDLGLPLLEPDFSGIIE